MNLVGRALGSLPDAAWIRRQFTLDADAVHDAVHGLRMLARTPGFTAIALAVFALGIGATTAIVSVADALLLRPLPVPQLEQVMTIWQYDRDSGLGQQDVAPGNAIDWIDGARSFQAIAMAEPSTLNTTMPGREPESLGAARVSEQFFAVLRAPMLHGRVFLPDEYRQGGPRVAILSYGMWQGRFAADPSIVGQSLRIDSGDLLTIVGVMPPGLELRLFDTRSRQSEPSVWLPKQGFAVFEPTSRGQGYWNVIGRLRPGASVEQARAEFDTLSSRLAREYPQTNARVAAQIVPLRTHLVGSLRNVLPLLLGAAAILLIVSCINVASLLLARGVARNREFAVRQALGASRSRLIRQMLLETLVLAVMGASAGLALARWGLNAIAALRPPDVAMIDAVPIDARAAVIASAVAIVAALVAGLTPSIQLSRPAAAAALKVAHAHPHRRARAALVIAEMAAALVLAVGAGLLVRSFVLIQRVEPGFDRDHVAALQVFASPRLDTPEKRIAFFQRAVDRLRVLPGVVAAGGVSAMPFGQAQVITRAFSFVVVGRAVPAGQEPLVTATAIEGDYLRAMRVPVRFQATDTPASARVVLVSQAAARRFWPDADPIGSRVSFRFVGTSYEADVVGVVGDVRHETLEQPAAPEVFVPYAQSGFRTLTFVVRTEPGTATTLQAMKEQIWAVDPLQAIFHTAFVDDLVARTLVSRRFSLFLLGGFALATLLLAVAGVYGVMSFATSQRMREFGVRIALGAGRADIMRLVLGEGLRLGGLGVVAGVLVAIPAMRVLRSLLFGVTATDALTFLSVSLSLVFVAGAASYVPARRALRIAAAEALRPE